MDSFEFNKIAGSVLGMLLFVMALGIITDIPFARAKLAKPGYDLPGATEEHAAAAPAAAEAAVPFPTLLASADPKKGEALAKVCAACHSFEKGVEKPTGPNLTGVVGREMGSTGFAGYSDTMKGMGKKWAYDSLNTFLTNPKGFVAGTKMGYAGEKDPKKRADLVAYLRSISPDAPPLPN